MVNRIAQGHPQVIAIDVSLFESAPGDEELAAALSGAHNVILVSMLGIVRDRAYNLEQLTEPVPRLSNAAATTGLANFPFDADGLVRRLHAYELHNGNVYDHWALRVAELVRKESLPAEPSPAGLVLGGRRIVLDDQSLYINYRGPARSFPEIPAAQVVSQQRPSDEFKDKIVLIGAVTESLHDTYPTPFLGDRVPMSGVEIAANAIETVLTGEYLQRVGPVETLSIVFLLGLAGLGLNAFKRPSISLSVMAVLMLGYALVWGVSFRARGIWLPVIAPEAALFLAFVMPAVEQGAVEGEEKRRLRHIFEQFVSPEMIKQLIEHGIEVPRGRRADLTVLFADLRGFTTISEELEPDELASLLNEYLGTMTEVIFRQHGTIDKFEGDAILAFWGAPVADPQHAQHAVDAAVEMVAQVSRLSDQWARRGLKRSPEIGIGLDSGLVFVGLIGSSKRMNYTVVGDHVNIAARLQDLAKEYHWPLLISESTYIQTKEALKAEFIATRSIRGKTVPVSIYRVLGVQSNGGSNQSHSG